MSERCLRCGTIDGKSGGCPLSISGDHRYLPQLWLNRLTGDTSRGLNAPEGDGWVRLDGLLAATEAPETAKRPGHDPRCWSCGKPWGITGIRRGICVTEGCYLYEQEVTHATDHPEAPETDG